MLGASAYGKLWRRPSELFLTGLGTRIAVIDHPFGQKKHPGFASNLIDVRAMNGVNLDSEGMHGAAVISIAVGEIGIARDAKIVFRAIAPNYDLPDLPRRKQYLEDHADALRSLRAYVEEERTHIDVISTSHGWNDTDPNMASCAAETLELVDWFENRNIPVFSTSTSPFIFPCGPKGAAAFLSKVQPGLSIRAGQVAIPIDNRLIARAGFDQALDKKGNLYVRCNEGGMSWAVPFAAAMFALAREALPNITRQEFVHKLYETARIVDFGDGGRLPVVNVAALAAAVSPEQAAYPRAHGLDRFQP